jgi:hypothetical protein
VTVVALAVATAFLAGCGSSSPRITPSPTPNLVKGFSSAFATLRTASQQWTAALAVAIPAKDSYTIEQATLYYQGAIRQFDDFLLAMPLAGQKREDATKLASALDAIVRDLNPLTTNPFAPPGVGNHYLYDIQQVVTAGNTFSSDIGFQSAPLI